MTPKSTVNNDWLRLIQAEYREMPGLRLTKAQMRRLWTLEPQACDALIDTLVASEFLQKTQRGSYVLASADR
jgi:hypothetical protein